MHKGQQQSILVKWINGYKGTSLSLMGTSDTFISKGKQAYMFA